MHFLLIYLFMIMSCLVPHTSVHMLIDTRQLEIRITFDIYPMFNSPVSVSLYLLKPLLLWCI